MGAGKNKAHRKKRISKHVIKANEKRKEEIGVDGSNGKLEDQKSITSQISQEEAKIPSTGTSVTNSSSSTDNSSKKKKKKNKRHVKDPAEATTYLSSWKHRKSGTNWKFNKNTQSWIVRHMYEASKINKDTFTLLIEYLISGDDGLKSRVRSEAMKRAVRYKEYEKSQQSTINDESDDHNDKDNGDKEDSKSNIDGDNTKLSSNTTSNPSIIDESNIDEMSRWKALNDHDKRKEYKRARKILDAIVITG